MKLFNKDYGKPTFAAIAGLAVLLAVLKFTFIPAVAVVTLATILGIYFNYDRSPSGKKVHNPGLHKSDLAYIVLAFLILIIGYAFKDAFNLETWATIVK